MKELFIIRTKMDILYCLLAAVFVLLFGWLLLWIEISEKIHKAKSAKEVEK